MAEVKLRNWTSVSPWHVGSVASDLEYTQQPWAVKLRAWSGVRVVSLLDNGVGAPVDSGGGGGGGGDGCCGGGGGDWFAQPVDAVAAASAKAADEEQWAAAHARNAARAATAVAASSASTVSTAATSSLASAASAASAATAAAASAAAAAAAAAAKTPAAAWHERLCLNCGSEPGVCTHLPPAFIGPDIASKRLQCRLCPRVMVGRCCFTPG